MQQQQTTSQAHLHDTVTFQSSPLVSDDEQASQDMAIHYQMTGGHTTEHTHGVDGVWPHEHNIQPAATSFRLPTYGHSANSTTTSHYVHVTDNVVATFEMTPPHPPRVETE